MSALGMHKAVTDRVLLKRIYDQYLDEFVGGADGRSSKIYVPIDCDALASQLGMDPEILFGRLYYHLDRKHGYTDGDGSEVHLFALRVGGDRHVIHFPLLTAVLAELEESQFRFTLPLVLSVAALLISIGGFFF